MANLGNLTMTELPAPMSIGAPTLMASSSAEDTVIAETTILGINRAALQQATSFINYFAMCFCIFGMSCIISIKDFNRKEMHVPQSVLIGLCLQYLLQPFVGYLVANLLRLPTPEALAIILLSSCPVSPYCAVLAYYGDGFIIVALCLAMFSTALSVGLLPFWFRFYSSAWTEDYHVVATPREIGVVEFSLVVPVILGVLFKRYAGYKASRIMAKICSFAFPITIAVSTVLKAIQNPSYYQADAKLWVGGFLLPMVGFLIGFLLTFIVRLPYEACSAVSLAVGTSNWFIAGDITDEFFTQDEMVRHDALTLVSIFSISMPLEGLVWSMMYRAIEEFLRKVYPKCCKQDDDDDEEERDFKVKSIRVENT